MNALQTSQIEADIATRIESEARAWLVRLDDKTVPLAERERFEQWLKTSPAHQAAYTRANRLWHGLAAMHELQALEPLERLTCRERFGSLLDTLNSGWTHLRQRPRWMVPAAMTAAVLLAAVVLQVTRGTRPDTNAIARYATETAQMREVRLPDGSTVTLGARSALETHYASGQRHVALVRGEAFFDIAPDAAQPFTLTAGDTLVRVLGTQFNVNRSTVHVRIDVIKGAVQISRLAAHEDTRAPGIPATADSTDRSDTGPTILAAGQHLVASPGAPLIPTAHSNSAGADAWREGRLVYFDARLEDIVADVSRYWPQHIRLASPALADLRLTASFRTSEIDALLGTLDAALPVDIERRDNGEIILRPETASPDIPLQGDHRNTS